MVVEEKVDYIVVFYVGSVVDVEVICKEIKVCKGDQLIIFKFEWCQVVENFDEIVQVFDVVMVVCGDFGVEVLLYEVFVIQKKIIEVSWCYVWFVIVVIQMFELMMEYLCLMCVELFDVVNVVFDGVDVLMFLGESVVGSFFVEVVGMMDCIICEVESYFRICVQEEFEGSVFGCCQFFDIEFLGNVEGMQEMFEMIFFVVVQFVCQFGVCCIVVLIVGGFMVCMFVC